MRLPAVLYIPFMSTTGRGIRTFRRMCDSDADTHVMLQVRPLQGRSCMYSEARKVRARSSTDRTDGEREAGLRRTEHQSLSSLKIGDRCARVRQHTERFTSNRLRRKSRECEGWMKTIFNHSHVRIQNTKVELQLIRLGLSPIT